jgi:DNA topoisomerase-3
MSVAILAEKPSVARDIARVVGATGRGSGCLHGNGYVVSWAIGHLVALPEPHDIRPEWKPWRADRLPMIPQTWPLKPISRTHDQFEAVSRILNSSDIDEVICATDAGREGELIFRYIYEAAGCTKPFRRLWISSLTPSAIRSGLDNLQAGREMDPLADAARGRSRADWLVGMNLSRAYTLKYGHTLSVGRVQTPTLSMLVDRELAIRNFVPEDYKEVIATFQAAEGQPCYEGVYFAPELENAGPSASIDKRVESTEEAVQRRLRARRLPADGVQADRIVERALNGCAAVKSLNASERKLPPPLLYDLTELQRHANRLFGFSAARTLELAQVLYEQKKLISYPRSDSRCLSRDVAEELPAVVQAIRARYAQADIAPGTGECPLSDRFVNDARVSDHHAIIPTTTDPSTLALSTDEERIYDLVCRRLLAAWHEDHLYSTTRVITTITARLDNDDVVDSYHSSGTRVTRQGWKVLDITRGQPSRSANNKKTQRAPADAVDATQDLPTTLCEGQGQTVVKAVAADKRTRPPRRFNDASLLTAMETAGRTLDEKELSDAMRDSGLGTPATRAAIIETLLNRGYIERDKKTLVATDKGIRLIDVVHPDVKSPIMTGRWEARLQHIQRGAGQLTEFMEHIETWVTEVTCSVLSGARPAQSVPGATHIHNAPDESPPRQTVMTAPPEPSAPVHPSVPKPIAADTLDALLHRRFGFAEFRNHQKEVCEAVAQGHDVLLVMPTGAGKSLCYQLPGIARGGTTLVVSPLIALMEDQVAKLQAQGCRTERIHSGRARLDARRVCGEYLDGNLDFLFIAPERLSVPGFSEMLAKRKPTLIAIDEAHCISQWGHDFRPDYRMLKERLKLLHPAPIVALTATATPTVQRDIVEQLGIAKAACFIHGFRRTNIAIEVVETPPGAREDLTLRILSQSANRPAIVYAPTRKKAESLCALLKDHMSCAVYHAGIPTATRDRVQADFLNSRLEVIVATIAFGMGIDKADVRTVIHTAIPGSVEGYYQEIGRAGRDGKPCRAILLHSFADRRTHEWFLDRDYPDAVMLERIFDALTETPQPPYALRDVATGPRTSAADFDKALEKLSIHGGAVITPEGDVTRGAASWHNAYLLQRQHKEAQLEQVAEYAEINGCRMLHMVTHFGDQEDNGTPCGCCDACAPASSIAVEFRPLTVAERHAAAEVLDALAERNGPSTGRLHQDLFGTRLARDHLEALLGALARSGLLRVEDDSFYREGKEIRFRRAFVTPDGRSLDVDALGELTMFVLPETRTRGSGQSATGRRQRRGRKAGSGKRQSATRRSAASRVELSHEDASGELVQSLKQWRLEESRRRRIPAYRILTDRTLIALAIEAPRDKTTMLAVRGIGPTLMRKYGEDILAITTR